jgi:hypothetical protein
LVTMAVAGAVATVLLAARLAMMFNWPPHELNSRGGDSSADAADALRRRWDPSKPFAATLSQERRPVILTHSVVTTWKATRRWDLEYIGRKEPNLRGVYVGTNPIFGPYFDASRPLAAHEEGETQAEVDMETMQLRNGGAKGEGDQTFAYYSGEIERCANSNSNSRTRYVMPVSRWPLHSHHANCLHGSTLMPVSRCMSSMPTACGSVLCMCSLCCLPPTPPTSARTRVLCTTGARLLHEF